tara:strand:+ start:1603 stop:1710 length:108 start_codon:yes stop_codon:yes gene_type:complete
MITEMLSAFDKMSIKEWLNFGKNFDGLPATRNRVD